MMIDLGPLNNHQRIQISEDNYIEYDPEDTWITIADENWFEYDRGGAVIVSAMDIDRLVKELLKVKEVLLADHLREVLANLCHEQWSGWMRYLFDKGQYNEDGTWTMPAWAVERWQRQLSTPYFQLSESEQENDRKEADKFLALLISACDSQSKREPPESREDSGDGSPESI